MTAEAMRGTDPEIDKEQGQMSRSAFTEFNLAVNANLPAVRIDGPFGAPAEDVFDNQVAVLIGAGIGL
jgi:NADPH oxidase